MHVNVWLPHDFTLNLIINSFVFKVPKGVFKVPLAKVTTSCNLRGALPQGTELGPIGFQVVINDAAQDLGDKIKCWKYVDDLTLAKNRSFPQPSGMQVVLDEFNEWTNNKLSLNPSKCQALQVCFKTNTPPHAELSIAGVPLSFVTEAKILGVWL